MLLDFHELFSRLVLPELEEGDRVRLGLLRGRRRRESLLDHGDDALGFSLLRESAGSPPLGFALG